MAGYKGNIIKKKYHGKHINFIKIECIIEKKPMDTFGCLNQIKNKLNDFYMVNGDTFFEANLQDIKITKSRIASMALIQNLNYSTNRKLSNLTINKNRNISNSKNSKLMNAGFCFFLKKRS